MTLRWLWPWREPTGMSLISEAYEAERARCRADQVWMLARVTEAHDAERARWAELGPFIAHLEAEVLFWRQQVILERERVHAAVDACRIAHLGLAPLNPTLGPGAPPPPMPTMPSVFDDPELALMGQ